MLIASLVIGMLPWRELSADANTHGKYTAKPFEISYEQNSTWGKSTQGQFVVKNTSKANVKSWELEIDYAGDVRLANIWNAKDITNYDSDKNIKVSCNTVIPAGQTKAATTEDEWLAFETLTLCFYDTSLIEMSLMTEDEIDWINAYHVRVYKEVAPLLNDEEKAYLAYKCQAIEI